MSNTALRTNLPSGRRCSLVALVALAFAAACSDVKSPIAPPDLKRSDDKSVVCSGSLDAQATAIQNAIVALYPVGSANQELNNFDAVKKSICAQGNLADGQKKALELVRLLFDDYNKGRFVGPDGAKRLLDLVAKIYAFAGLSDPFASGGPSNEDYRRLLNDGAIGFAQPGQPFQQVANTGNFALKTDNNFFVAPAIVIMFRVPDGTLDLSYSYPPVYEVKVFPASAQANFVTLTAATAQANTPPKASIASCVADPHPPRSTLALYQSGSVNATLPTSSAAILLLSCNPLNYVYPPIEIGLGTDVSTPFLAVHRFGARLSNGFRVFGRSLLDALTPRSLYAWDGGVGGATGFLDGDFGPVSPTL